MIALMSLTPAWLVPCWVDLFIQPGGKIGQSSTNWNHDVFGIVILFCQLLEYLPTVVYIYTMPVYEILKRYDNKIVY